jgi:hypothetical protein
MEELCRLVLMETRQVGSSGIYTLQKRTRWTLQDINTVKPGYNDIDLYDTSSIASDILWY